jgi:hypothetical protein
MTPNPVRPCEIVTLTWKTNAERVYLIADSNHGDWTTKIDCFGGFLGALSSYSVQIEEQREFMLYTIDEDAFLPTSCMDSDLTLLCGCAEMRAISNPFGGSAYVSVVCSPDTWFFHDPPQACPARDAAELKPRAMVIQAFAGGTVIHTGRRN